MTDVIDWYRQKQAVEADRRLMRETEREESPLGMPRWTKHYGSGYQNRHERRKASKREGAVRNLRQGLKKGGWQAGRRHTGWLHPDLTAKRVNGRWVLPDPGDQHSFAKPEQIPEE